MTHELTINAGVAEMAYTGKTPWHGLGQALEAGASMATWRTAAGMNWSIESAPVMYDSALGTMRMPERVVLHRSDTADGLGVVSSGYQVVQPAEVLAFFHDVTGAAGCTLETAGTLFGGRRFWALARTGAESAVIDGRDRIKGYVLLSTSADGTLATEARHTHVRVVCHNTLSAALARGKSHIRVSHRSKFDATEARKALGIDTARDAFADAMAEFRQMAETRIAPVDVLKQTGALFVPGFAEMETADKVRLMERVTGPVARVGQLALNRAAMGSDMDGTAGTVWGWLNAVTEYVDHEGRSRTPDNRLAAAWYGAGNDIKTRAREVAMEMVSANGGVTTVYAPAPMPAAAVPYLREEVRVSLDDVLAATAAQ